jgi:hypothetical protein
MPIAHVKRRIPFTYRHRSSWRDGHVRLVPKPDSCTAAIGSPSCDHLVAADQPLAVSRFQCLVPDHRDDRSRYAIANRPFAPRRSPCWQPNDRAPRRPRCRSDSECRPRCATRWPLGRAPQAWRHHAGTGTRGWRPWRSKGSRARLDSLDGSVSGTVGFTSGSSWKGRMAQ